MIRLPGDLLKTLTDGGTVVVPSRQRAHASRLAFAAAQLHGGARVWATPDVLTAEAWLIREIEERAGRTGAQQRESREAPGARRGTTGTRLPRLLSPAEDWLLWRECTSEATRDLELLNRGALAESLRRARTLAVEFGIDSLALALVGTEAELFGQVQQAVDERCRAIGAASVPMLLAQLSVEPGVFGEITCAGFLSLPPRLQACGATPRDTVGSLVRPRALVVSDESEELESIAEWCKQQIAKQADARLLVILPGSAGGRERLATLIRQAVDPAGWLSSEGAAEPSRIEDLVAIEGGAPLADVPVVAHALATLRWLGGSSGEIEEVSEWLRAPYWDVPEATDRARVDLWLRETGQMSINGRKWATLLDAAPSPIGESARVLSRQIDAAIQALGEGVASPREWSERFRAALNAVRWPGERTRDSSEQQTVLRFHELLDEFGQLASSTPVMALNQAIHWFSEFASQTPFRPADGDAVVTISAALADPIVHYDGIWVAGLHAEAFPQPVQPDPFIPLAAQIAAGIPAASANGRLQEAHALVAAWRAATPELIFSAPARSEDLELLPSPLLIEWLLVEREREPEEARPAKKAARKGTSARASATQMELGFEMPAPAAPALVEAPPPATRGSGWLAKSMHRANMLEYFDDSKGLPWPTAHVLPGGTRSLELQNLCAFRAYSELRLGSGELGVPEPGVAPDVRGRLLHAALQALWNELRDSEALARHDDATLDCVIERSVARAADGILGQAADGERPAVFVRECRRTARLIKRLCELERSRDPFQVADTEFERTLAVSGAEMKVRIDRLDTLATGGHAILDYKSGRRTTADWYGDRPSHPQLLAYLAALGDGVVAMATVNVTAREVRFDGIAHSPHLLPKVRGVEGPPGEAGEPWVIRSQQWRACVERLATDFLVGRAALDPKPGACDFCHAVSVCRIADRGIEVAAEVRTIQFDGIQR